MKTQSTYTYYKSSTRGGALIGKESGSGIGIESVVKEVQQRIDLILKDASIPDGPITITIEAGK
jgi:hypothetical protein